MIGLGKPEPGEIVRWSGPCTNDKAHGEGVMAIYANGKLVEAVRLQIENGEVDPDVKEVLTKKDHPDIPLLPDPKEAGWIADPVKGCIAWNRFPQPDETIRWSGDCDSGRISGTGIFQWFLDGKPGERIGGEFQDGVTHGFAKFSDPDGRRYEGNYVEGEPTGKGKDFWPNGDRYEGDYVKGERTGKGKHFWPNGDRYEGDFVKGKITGQGTKWYADGRRYDGSFLDNYQHGNGILIFPDGERYIGEIANEKPNGLGTWYTSDGKVYAGVSNDGCFRNETSRAAIGRELYTCP